MCGLFWYSKSVFLHIYQLGGSLCFKYTWQLDSPFPVFATLTLARAPAGCRSARYDGVRSAPRGLQDCSGCIRLYLAVCSHASVRGA